MSDYQGLVDTIWTVKSVDSNGNVGLAQNETLTFTPNMTIAISGGATWGWYAVQNDRLTGARYSDLRGFDIFLDPSINGSPRKLRCYLKAPSPTQGFWAVALGVVVGVLTGAVAGVAAGFPVARSVLAALAAALPASLATARLITPSAGTSAESWTAEDGKTGGKQTWPQALSAVGA